MEPGGLLAVDVWRSPGNQNPSLAPDRATIAATQEHGALEFPWRETRESSRATRTHCFTVKEIDGRRRSWEHAPIELAWYEPAELDALGGGAGLTAVDRHGGIDGHPTDPGGGRLIWIFRTS
jgi:hypothetical protein